MPETTPRPAPQSIDETLELLSGADYVADRALATVLFLSLRMKRPLFLEGEAGVGLLSDDHREQPLAPELHDVGHFGRLHVVSSGALGLAGIHREEGESDTVQQIGIAAIDSDGMWDDALVHPRIDAGKVVNLERALAQFLQRRRSRRPEGIVLQEDVVVEQVDFVTAPGATPEHVYREGGPTLVVTSKAVLGWDSSTKEWVLQHIHPGSSVEDVKQNTGFDLRVVPSVQITPPPTTEELYTLRTVVREKLARLYPDFARQKIRYAPLP